MFRSLAAVCLWIFLLLPAPETARAGERVFRISTSYKSLLSTPEQTGMLDMLLKEAFRRSGLRAEIVFTPTERSMYDVDAGLLDGEINRIEGMEKRFPNLVRVPEPNMTMRFVAFSNRPYPVDGWESLKNLHVGVVGGWRILEEHTVDFPKRILVPSETELFTMLHKGRIDVALYDKLTGYETISRLGFPEIRHLEPPLINRDMFLYMHKSHSEVVGTIAEALREMKLDGAYDRIVSEATARLGADAR